MLTAELNLTIHLYDKYIILVNNPYHIACQDEIDKIDRFLIRHWLNSLVIERLQHKSELILKIFLKPAMTGKRHFTGCLSRYFGFRVNTEPFEMLASALPFKIIRKHADNSFQIEAFFLVLQECLRRDFSGKHLMMNITWI